MVRFVRGNLLEADTEAIVNTVNTVGVMGKGIALQFKEAYPDNYKAYVVACKAGDVRIGHMFSTRNTKLTGPKWIINFPTKQDWKHRTKIEWIIEGLGDLKRFVKQENIRSIAIPPLGCGNGGLPWGRVRHEIIVAMGDLDGVDVAVYEPTSVYMAHAKQSGVEVLTPARAMIAEMVRRYSVLGFECSLLEAQKLAWFLDRSIQELNLDDPLKLKFVAHRYGPYSEPLNKLLNALDGSFLHCNKRLSDAKPNEIIWFDLERRKSVEEYFQKEEVRPYQAAMDRASRLIDGFESPLGMELLATVDWLLVRDDCPPTIEGIKAGLQQWPGGGGAARRKLEIFDDRLIKLALERLPRRSVDTSAVLQKPTGVDFHDAQITSEVLKFCNEKQIVSDLAKAIALAKDCFQIVGRPEVLLEQDFEMDDSFCAVIRIQVSGDVSDNVAAHRKFACEASRLLGQSREFIGIVYDIT
jgi:O-acetyl-ADP-ribose deacetylase (regulator of RNase III)